jgi:hypothetical protein
MGTADTDVARCVEADVGGEPLPGVAAVRLPEALHDRIDGRHRAFGEAHHGDAVGADAGVAGQGVERPVGIDRHGQRVQLGLVGHGAGDAPPGEAVEDQDGEPGGVEVARPEVEGAADAARAVHEHHGRDLRRRTGREAQFAR